ncbi:uncharacterized protein LOC128682090 isoform X2 [Plodia interpunctella]|uniref:uncharacterized protein LOC128682090 isoform X2 n=1 Tax=Plodia interpunctella TaxID=58824 RepID=UPI0023682CDA|nr:uncharacterized protein LOC128682090 isoform X2 [Plodia interpunctella]
MNLLLHLFHVLIYSSFNGYGYILFAANIDDFKIIAKKYMPDIFAEKLVQIAADTSVFNENDGSKSKNNTLSANNTPMKPKNIGRSGPQIQFQKGAVVQEKDITYATNPTGNNNHETKKIPLSGIDIDELVEKIKERLDKQYLEKYKNYLVSTTSNLPPAQYSKIVRYAQATEEPNQKDGLRKPVPQAKQAEYDYFNKGVVNERRPVIQPLIKKPQQGEVVQDVEPKDFETKDLTNTKDSYEDYKVPPKYEEVIYPTTSKTIKISTSKSPYKIKVVKKPKNYDYEDLRYDDEEKDDQNEYDKFKSSEIKAQTENLNDDYPDATEVANSYKETGNNNFYREADGANPNKASQGNPNVYKATDSGPNSQKVSPGGPQKGYRNREVSRNIKGTGIPTRERFSMSSPNYYASIPIVAEKYDFNEPLPEKDREPEDMRYLKNPPAKINQKVEI